MPSKFTTDLLVDTSSGSLPSFPRSERPEVWARNRVVLKTKKYQKIPFFYKDSLRYLISTLGDLVYINSEEEVVPIQCVHANAERTIAKLKQENNIILPIISISQSSSDNDDERRRSEPSIINESWWSDEKKRAFRVLSLAPRAVNIEYSINIWAKYKSNLDQIVEQVRLLFNPHLIIETKYSNTAHGFIVQESDNSTLDLGDRQDRVIRRAFTIKLEGYIPNPKFLITSTGEIQELNGETTIF